MADPHSGAPSPHAGGLLSLQRVVPYEHRGIALTSPGIDADGRLDAAHSAYADDISPALSWSAVIEAQTYALIVEDPDAPGDRPFLHWLLWNVPGTLTSLAAGIPRTARLRDPEGAVQGLNGAGAIGWHGARPPPGHGVHRYHFQLFALAGRLDHLDPESPLEILVDALKGMTIASGEIVGTFERSEGDFDAPSPARTGGYGEDPFEPNAAETEAGRGGLDRDDRDRHAPHAPGGEVRA